MTSEPLLRLAWRRLRRRDKGAAAFPAYILYAQRIPGRMRRSFFPIQYAANAIALEHNSQLGRSLEWTLIHPLPAFHPATIILDGIL